MVHPVSSCGHQGLSVVKPHVDDLGGVLAVPLDHRHPSGRPPDHGLALVRQDTSDRLYPGCRLVGHWSHRDHRSEEHTSELQSLMRNSYAVFCLKKKKTPTLNHNNTETINNQ